MSIDQKELSSILGSEIVGEICPRLTILTSTPWYLRTNDFKKWLDSFKTELIKLCGFIIRPGAIQSEVWAEIIEMYPEDAKESAKKFADSKGLFEIY